MQDEFLTNSVCQCVMITGDNPLTAVHVARDVEIVDREVMILDLKEGTTSNGESLRLRNNSWKTVAQNRNRACVAKRR